MSSDTTDPDPDPYLDPADPDTADPDTVLDPADPAETDPAPEIPDEEQDEKLNKEQDKEEVPLESKIMNSMIVKLYNKCIGTDKDIIEQYGTQVTVITYSSLNL